MEAIVLVLMIWTSPTEITRIEVDYDTKRDCLTTSALMGKVPGLYSVDCYTKTLNEDPVEYRIEQGI